MLVSIQSRGHVKIQLLLRHGQGRLG
jgi:hypothetical protein